MVEAGGHRGQSPCLEFKYFSITITILTEVVSVLNTFSLDQSLPLRGQSFLGLKETKFPQKFLLSTNCPLSPKGSYRCFKELSP